MMTKTKGRVVIGSLKGNTYGLGKDIVADALSSAGFEVIDLGVDVPPEAFVDTAIKKKANVIAISISADETIPFLKEVVEILNKKNMRDAVKIVIGGNAASEKTRMDYAVDAYAKDAQDCVKKVEKLLWKA
jgi:methylmalonyl-CoA mutase cobalamin-binding domain/chain